MRKLPKIISTEEYEKLLVESLKVKKIKKARLRRYWMAMVLGGEAGLRISEIVGWENRVPELTKKNIDIQRRRIFLESAKGQKDRVVGLPRRLLPRHIELLPLKLDRRALQHFVTTLGKRVLDKDISFHTLRHYFGSQCAERMPLHEVQALMGHSRLDTTGIYLHANPTKAIAKQLEVFG